MHGGRLAQGFTGLLNSIKQEIRDLKCAQRRSLGAMDFYTTKITVRATPMFEGGEAVWGGHIVATAKAGEIAPFFMQIATSSEKRYTSLGATMSDRSTDWEILIFTGATYAQDVVVTVYSSCDVTLRAERTQ